jgi:hypothetical protein
LFDETRHMEKAAARHQNPGATRKGASPSTRVAAVMQAAERTGLLRAKSDRIGGRVSPALVAQAKKQTGIEADTELIEFALASVALEDGFADAFKAARGRVDRDVPLSR